MINYILFTFNFFQNNFKQFKSILSKISLNILIQNFSVVPEKNNNKNLLKVRFLLLFNKYIFLLIPPLNYKKNYNIILNLLFAQ